MKKFISGFILSAVLFSVIPLYAATQQAISISYNNIKILANGKTVPTDTEPFIYNGQVFAPVESIAKALGKNSKYNVSTGSVVISDVVSPTPDPTASDSAKLKALLAENYASLTTDLGATTFTFEVVENKINLISHDYRIMVYYNHSFFDKLHYSTAVDTKTRESVKAQLKEHQKNLANALITAMPDKKFLGGYYDKGSSGLSVQVDSDYYFCWTNYAGNILANYHDAYPSTFRWYSSAQKDWEG